jgi:hypothetical protein
LLAGSAFSGESPMFAFEYGTHSAVPRQLSHVSSGVVDQNTCQYSCFMILLRKPGDSVSLWKIKWISQLFLIWISLRDSYLVHLVTPGRGTRPGGRGGVVNWTRYWRVSRDSSAGLLCACSVSAEFAWRAELPPTVHSCVSNQGRGE